jgi:hypothetical protein
MPSFDMAVGLAAILGLAVIWGLVVWSGLAGWSRHLSCHRWAVREAGYGVTAGTRYSVFSVAPWAEATRHVQVPRPPYAAAGANGSERRRVRIEAWTLRVDEASEVFGGFAVGGAAALGVVLGEDLGAVALALGDGGDVEAGVEEFG